jgi:hypothetical protein
MPFQSFSPLVPQWHFARHDHSLLLGLGCILLDAHSLNREKSCWEEKQGKIGFKKKETVLVGAKLWTIQNKQQPVEKLSASWYVDKSLGSVSSYITIEGLDLWRDSKSKQSQVFACEMSRCLPPQHFRLPLQSLQFCSQSSSAGHLVKG